MSVTARLVFDPTDADTRAASSNIGAYVRAGDDGTVIGHVSDALKVSIANASLSVTQGTSPWVIGDGGGSITVDATDLDIRDLAFATDKVDVSGSSVSISGTVAVTQSTSPWVIGDGGGSITVDATDLDIRDLVAATDSISSWTKDGSGNSIGSTGGALNVAITSGFVDVDDSLANTSIENESRTVGGTAINTTAAAALAARKWLYLANVSNKAIFFGKSGVTLANGFPVYPGDKHEFRIGASVTTQVIGDGTGLDLRVMQLS